MKTKDGSQVNMIQDFSFTRCPRIYFAHGSFGDLPDMVGRLGRSIVVLTGAGSLQASGRLDELMDGLRRRDIVAFHLAVEGEPSPEMVDGAVGGLRGIDIDLVLAVGGGSVLDAGKAVSAMLREAGSVLDFLEGVGNAEHSGRKVPFIAVPTTAGTGSEATKNAVLSRVGPGGFKRSLRHDNFVPDSAVIDPELHLPCPPDITAACGMDALTQLLESYVSTGASPLTDALALSGLGPAIENLVPACSEGAGDAGVRAGMAYAALLSGMTLANAGLGVVHGFASSLGGLFEIPHGVICGTLLGATTRTNVEWLRDRGEAGRDSLVKYARAGALTEGREPGDIHEDCELLLDAIEAWTRKLGPPLLGEYGVAVSDIDGIVEKTGLKNNPARLSNKEMRGILEGRI